MALLRCAAKTAQKLYLEPTCLALQQQRHGTTKHYDPKFRDLRRKKILKVELPNYDEMQNDDKMTPDEMRAKMKERGVAPPRPWIERPIFLSCTGAVFEPYLPPEGDGKMSLISKEGAKQRMAQLIKKGQSFKNMRKIRSFEEEFYLPQMADESQDIYIKAHEALAEKDEDTLHELVTERCFPEMMFQVKNKTLRWKFLKSLEPAHAVHVRCTDVLTKENVFAQVTVRFHTQQTLAIYDRFGRLMYGNESMAKDVLEYVVFEKHLANMYGKWRIHAKIIPDWVPPKDPVQRTFRQ